MASATETTIPAAVLPTPPAGGEDRTLLADIGWEGYQRLMDRYVDCGPRMFYLDGSVEQMSPGYPHERLKKILSRMVEDLITELGIPANAAGSVGFLSKAAGRGFEPDECYFLGNASRLAAYIAGPARTSEHAPIDLEFGPPPDLVVEVEITSSPLDKLAIYAGLGVPELWRYDGRKFRLLLLQADGSYADSPTSRAFSFLPIDGFVHHLGRYDPAQETPWARAYRAWVREVVAPMYHP